MNIIITGASQGIGRELVLKMAQDPKNKIIAIARTKEKLETLKSECLKKFKNEIIVISVDLTSAKAQSLLNSNITSFKNIDILINNAGLLINKTIFDISMPEVKQLFEINVYSVISLIKILLNADKFKNAHIVNIGSMGGFQGSAKFVGLSSYSATKSALSCLSECLAVELSRENISVNCLALGAVDTEMLQKAFPEYQSTISASKMADYICEFAINGNKYFNGKTIPVTLSTP